MEFSENMKTALAEMCNRVNVSFDDVDFTDEQWYTKHSWTHKEQDSYKEWYATFIKSNWAGLYTHRPLNKKQATMRAMWFVTNYGWINKENLA